MKKFLEKRRNRSDSEAKDKYFWLTRNVKIAFREILLPKMKRKTNTFGLRATLRSHSDECPHQESNLNLGLRSPLFYPLNYEGKIFFKKEKQELIGSCFIITIFPQNITSFLPFLPLLRQQPHLLSCSSLPLLYRDFLPLPDSTHPILLENAAPLPLPQHHPIHVQFLPYLI